MRQPSIKCIGEITNLGADVLGGLDALGAELKLRVIKHDEFKVELNALENQQTAYGRSHEEWAKRSAALKRVVKECRSFMRLTRDALKPVFGYQYSPSWNVLGLNGTLMIPMTSAKLNPMLKMICEYLKKNPQVEVPKLEVTLAHALQMDAALDAAVQALASHDLAMATLLGQRNVQAEKVRGLIRLLTAELHYVLPPLDPRWQRFGLNLPGAKERPSAPEGVEFQMLDEGNGALKWPKVPRAERYRVWMRAVGSPEEPAPVATVYDPDYKLETLPAVETEVWITALNSGGESGKSGVVRVGAGGSVQYSVFGVQNTGLNSQ